MESGQPNDNLIGLRPVERHLPIGIMPNEAHQDALGFMSGAPYELAIVEFDDQGRCYDRKQLDKVSERLEDMRMKGEDVILVVFVHGWKHNAQSDDDNLSSFRRVLSLTVAHERTVSTSGSAPRPVRGIYIGWRGLSAYGIGDAVADGTFWGRQEAAHRVSTGSPREVFGRLRHYRNARLEAGGAPLLVITGHSFGGLIVYSSLAQSLIESASAPVGHVVTRFADLVLLVNPAIEGARYLPIQDLVTSDGFKKGTDKQLPVFICIQAENDQPVGTWFAVGNATKQIDEAVIGDLERRCVAHAIGFIDEFVTHHITGPSHDAPFVLQPPSIQQKNPFWIVRATKDVIDGHGGIWGDTFLSFLAAVLFQQVTTSKVTSVTENGQPSSVTKAMAARARAAGASSKGSLADYATTIKPVLKPNDAS